jgi:Rad3-related DNA helicase
MTTLLENFPHPIPRQVQIDFLRELEANWDTHDVFVVEAPTSTGKSALSVAIANWVGRCHIITNTNLLVSQYQDEFPEIPILHGTDYYPESRPYGYQEDLYRFSRSGISVTNYHMYALQLLRNRYKNSRPTLIIDEAHNTIPFLQEMHSVIHWKHKLPRYPWMKDKSYHSIRKWMEYMAGQDTTGKWDKLYDATYGEHPRYVVEEREALWSAGGRLPDGIKMKRGEPELLPQLVLRPVDLRDYPETLWERKFVPKLIMMSATISPVDIRLLGLDSRRVCYLRCASPIPAERREIHVTGTTAVSHTNMVSATISMIPLIKEIEDRHAGTSGVIHATYEQARILRQHLHGDQYMFHTAEDKTEKYEQFRRAEPGTVLVASGLYEGVSLDYDVARWQCVTKVPWQSLGSPAVKYMARKDSTWYNWNTLRTLIQACGRVTRTPTDYGVTYILDRSALRLYSQCEKSGIVPEWFREAWQGQSEVEGLELNGTENEVETETETETTSAMVNYT